MRLVPASQFSHAELASLFTAAFQDYGVPMQVDEPAFRRMHDLFDLDLDASRVALRDGRPIGLANLGIREREGWIGGAVLRVTEQGVVIDQIGAAQPTCSPRRCGSAGRCG